MIINEHENSEILATAYRPIPKMKVRWRDYDCIIQKVKYRTKIAKIIPDYEGNPMPYNYFWVDFKDIGF